MRIPVSHGHLEAALSEPDLPPRGAAVVCHPHPIHGGTMHTKAVYHAARGFVEAGLVALRFNFRGVGTSTGSHDEGHGEKDDVGAALDWLEVRAPTLPLVVGGFSFGSMVGLSRGAEDARVVALTGIGLPLGLDGYDYTFLADVAKPVLVVQGENDQYGSGEVAARALAPMGPHITLVRVPGADHFFADRLGALREAIRGYYAAGPGARSMATV